VLARLPFLKFLACGKGLRFVVLCALTGLSKGVLRVGVGFGMERSHSSKFFLLLGLNKGSALPRSAGQAHLKMGLYFGIGFGIGFAIALLAIK
jgi:hypothetical protein